MNKKNIIIKILTMFKSTQMYTKCKIEKRKARQWKAGQGVGKGQKKREQKNRQSREKAARKLSHLTRGIKSTISVKKSSLKGSGPYIGNRSI